ncbi:MULTISPECIES: hypothetical protein [Chryseobacterium]|uniref:DUF4251 domain-containing protein n=1 Tax=Chryseobacterium gallinarum TaxID=1324352 RepID=A0A0G3M1I9_CHRGL|nr:MULTISPECIES: hypothetical protein [Chryseobacterium]AKK71883.1 hypothetical protein OK18_03840 [Chryseobacterium gallinarum]QIY92374.1 hypothetical protein FOB44_17685 [Chryseobacterium gallinarum]
MKKLSIITFLTLFIMCSAQKDYEVKPYTAYLSEYKPYYTMMYSEIQEMNIPLSEKLKLLNDGLLNLKTKFKKDRKSEFESKSVELAVTNWCTSKSSGGKKNCGYSYVSAPSPAFYTTNGWIRVVGTNKGTSVAADGSSAGLKMTVAGKGKNKGTLYAVFKYRPDYTVKAVEDDTDKLFSLIIN